MSCTRLPLELIGAILDYLHNDKRALAACSLVCQAWVHSARCHLFADAILNQRGIEKLVKSKTTAIPFVRRLHLKGDIDSQFWNETFPLLVGFKSVWSLELESLPWNDMTPNAQSVLSSQLTSVVRLCLSSFGVTEFSQLAQIICAFPRLKTLVIDFGHWIAGDSSPSTLCPPHSLRALELRFCPIDHILQWFLSFERMPPLHTVHLHGIDTDSSHTLDRFLQSLGPSLEVFSFDVYGIGGMLSSSLTLSVLLQYVLTGWPTSLGHNTHLRSLCAELYASTDIVRITRTLSQIVSTHIDEVCFSVFCRPSDDRDEDEEWDKVDKILTQPLFSNLRRVEFVCFNTRALDLSAQGLADFKVWVVTHLPRCRFRGILSICEDPRKEYTSL